MSNDKQKSVFLTGSTGYVGSRVAKLLLSRGYRVHGLVRSPEAAEKLKTQHGPNFEPVLGSLSDLDKIENAARNADGVIHTAFIHDFDKYAESLLAEKAVLASFRKALQNSGKTLIATSGTGVLGDTGTNSIDDENQAEKLLSTVEQPKDGKGEKVEPHGRSAAEIEVLMANRDAGFKASLVRLPLYVFGHGGSSFVPMYLDSAKKAGKVRYIDGRDISYSAIHVDDAAELYVAAFEKTNGGAIYHASSEIVTMKQLAEAVALNLGLELAPINDEEALAAWGPTMKFFYTTNNKQTNSRSTRELGWVPKSPVKFFEDVARGSYVQK